MYNKQKIEQQVKTSLIKEFGAERNTPYLRERVTDFVMDYLRKMIHEKGYFSVTCSDNNNEDGKKLVVEFAYLTDFGRDRAFCMVTIGPKDLSGLLKKAEAFIG